MLKLDLINAAAFGGAVLFVGYGIRRLIPPLARYNLPAPSAPRSPRRCTGDSRARTHWRRSPSW
jgi:hypothetical protein